MMGLDIEGVLAAERCRDVHGDTYTAPWCQSCRGWAAHVAAVLREQIAAAQAEAWERGWADAQRSRMTAPLSNPYRAAQLAPARVPSEEG